MAHYSTGPDDEKCGVTDEDSTFKIICRHGREYFACDQHVGELLREAMTYDGMSGLRVEAVGWTGG